MDIEQVQPSDDRQDKKKNALRNSRRPDKTT
jgi:hypothetical protein